MKQHYRDGTVSLVETMSGEPKQKAQLVEDLNRAAQAGDERAIAILSAAGNDLSPERLNAEYLIAEGKCRIRDARDYDDLPFGDAFYDVKPIEGVEEHLREITLKYNKEWLLADKPDGTVVPSASGRETVRMPNLNSTNLSFAARLILYVRDRFGGDAPRVYHAAHVSRKTYSSIISNELRPVSKHTAIAFALALQLSIDETNALLSSAGHALSTFMLEDIIVNACIVSGIYDIERVNEIMAVHNSKPLPCQDDGEKKSSQ